MNRGPYATLTNGVGRKFSVHHSAVLWVEQADDGAYIMLRIGNNKESYKVQTPYDEVMKELEKARRAEIVSFGE